MEYSLYDIIFRYSCHFKRLLKSTKSNNTNFDTLASKIEFIFLKIRHILEISRVYTGEILSVKLQAEDVDIYE